MILIEVYFQFKLKKKETLVKTIIYSNIFQSVYRENLIIYKKYNTNIFFIENVKMPQ